MSERTFVTYEKKDGNIITVHKFLTTEDSAMFPDSEMIDKALHLASKNTGMEESQLDTLELKEELKEGQEYQVDVAAKRLKSKEAPKPKKRKTQ